jgi:RNA polymerase sigma factor (sigma-70 family)
VRNADHPAAYVRRLMINAHLSWVRRLTNTERVLEIFPDTASGDLQSAHAESDEMRRALLRLTPRVRTAVVLRYFDDLSEVETAQLMGCSRSTVNNHVFRGLAALRELLSPDVEPTSGRTA